MSATGVEHLLRVVEDLHPASYDAARATVREMRKVKDSEDAIIKALLYLLMDGTHYGDWPVAVVKKVKASDIGRKLQ